MELDSERVYSYQLIRGVLLLTDRAEDFVFSANGRRPDLVEAWYGVTSAVKIYDLRCRLQMLTWQELTSVLSGKLEKSRQFKFGI